MGTPATGCWTTANWKCSCDARAGDIDQSFCRISFFQLLGNAERYHEQRVEFVAYAALVNDKVLLFPTEDLSRQWDLSSAVEIRSTVRTGPVGVGWIKVNGVFSAMPSGRGDPFVGGLRGVRTY